VESISKNTEGLIKGRATACGTRRYAERFASLPGAFRCPDGLFLSSLALGTRRGAPAGADDLLYRSAVAYCFESGVNVINTALSDRVQTSERAVGAAIRRSLREELVARDEIVVVTKGGRLTPDPGRAGSWNEAQWDLQDSYVDTGLVDLREIANGHSISPGFLEDQIRRSRSNLGLETLDFYLIEEPELHLRPQGATQFQESLAETFAMLENAVRRGWIGAYGLCTWQGLLLPHTERDHLGIWEIFELALDVGSADHHLRAIQLPFGAGAGEGVILPSQLGAGGQSAPVLEALDQTGTTVFASAPLFGGRVLGQLPDFVREAFPEARSDAQCCLQFARSSAGITAAVVGMRDPEHLNDNLALLRSPPAAASVPASLFAKARLESA